METLLLGVNGGDNTEAVITTVTGAVLGRGLGPASNHHRVGLDKACQALQIAVDRALAHAQSRGTEDTDYASQPLWIRKDSGISAAVFGLSGVDGPEDQAAFTEWLKQLGCSYKFLICNDSE